ncbi:MAG: nucleotidyltransferase domain-containing protein [Candidatus Marinamargulisbacteria bacterium]
MGNNINMKVTSFLSQLFSEKKIRVLKYFSDYQHGQFTGRELSNQINLNHKTCLIILNELHDIGLITKDIVGRSHIFKYRPSFYWEEVIFKLIEKEKGMIKQITNDIVAGISHHVERIILFGSMANKTEREDSDIDICLIIKKKKNGIDELKQKLEDNFYDKYLCHLSLYIVTELEFKKSEMAIIKEIKEEGMELWSKQKK